MKKTRIKLKAIKTIRKNSNCMSYSNAKSHNRLEFNMKIGEIIRRKDEKLYNKLMQMAFDYSQCMRKKCKDCKKKKECFKEKCNEV